MGLYLRLSREDEERGESQSISNQREYLRQYAAARGWTVAAIYTDDGYTGTSFNRPGFRQLLADVEAGKINTVLTKDLSRLGRDQIGTMYYYQIYFPQRRVRYIAVSEGIDTGTAGSGELILPFLAAANDFYTADISRKVRTALEVRKKSGRFIGAQPPMGYRKDPEAPGHLIPDPETGPVIGLLFRTFLSCGSVSGTARAMTQGGIPTPSQYKKGPQGRFPGLWSGTMVRRILTNPTYAGHLTQNRARKVGYKVEKRVTLPREAWIVVPNTHQPLVSQQVFDRTQALLAVRSYAPKAGSGHLLTGLAFCADCGSPMTYVSSRGGTCYMVCQGNRRGGCASSHCVREDAVLESIRRQLAALAADTGAQAEPPEESVPSSEEKMKAMTRWADTAGRLYRDREAGLLTEEEFCALLDQTRRTREAAERYRTQTSAAHEAARQAETLERLDRDTLTALVERVVVHREKTLEVFFRFRRPEEG